MIATAKPTAARQAEWRGSIPLRLIREGLIVRMDDPRSSRSCRHRGWLAVWLIQNREAVDARRFAPPRTLLAALDAAQSGTGPTMPVVEPVESAITHQPNEEANDGQAK